MQEKCVIIIPCFNEEKRLDSKAFTSFLSLENDFDLCFVNDGSNDKTLKLLNQIVSSSSNTSIINLEKNVGKAEAIRQAILGVEAEKYSFIAYIDADLSTSLIEFKRLYISKIENVSFIFGSRIKTLGTSIKRSTIRHILGRVLATFTNIFILRSTIYDTQCGAKLMTTALAKKLFKDPFISPWLFDIELFLRAEKIISPISFKKYVIEFPIIEWHDKGKSKISFFDFLKIPFEFYRIYINYKIKC